MIPIRTIVFLLFAAGAIYGAFSSYRSYQELRFYTYVEPDLSLAESYEMELWFKVPSTLVSAAVSLAAAAPLLRRR